jgi:uncharacterized protein with NRDE domain
MCLILAAYKTHPEIDLAILANRDEFYARPTKGAHWWDEGILAGKDLKAGGTWLGVNRAQQFSALTNYRDPKGFRPDARSRGSLVIDYLKERQPVCDYGSRRLQNVGEYNDFNLIFFEDEVLYYYNSLEKEIEELDPGIYGLSNHILNTPWPKVKRGREQLKELVLNGGFNTDEAFKILYNKSLAKDEELPDTGVGIDTERLLSAMHIDFTGYGTRSSNVVLFGKDGSVEFYERDHLTGDKKEFKF